MKAIGSNVIVRGQVDSVNARTRIAPVLRAPANFATLFVGAYDSFASICRAIAEPGLALVAVAEATGQLAGIARLAAIPGQHVAAIVGRHDRCDLFLGSNDDLPLRQLAVILDPVTRWERGRAEVSYRILDLRTERGFVDEQGRVLRGLRCDGSAVLRCAGYALYVLPLGDPTDWPESGADAWACQPERVYFDEVTHLARGSSTRVPKFSDDRAHRTQITAIRGPRETGTSLLTDDDLVGMLELNGPERQVHVRVGQAALRDGVLLGRYARCDSACVDDDSISRVHALLIQIDDALIVVDTASTNGTTAPGHEAARVHSIRGATDLTLGFSTHARWRWLS